MLRELGWSNLEDRRRDLRLALLFKICYGHVGITPEDIGLEPGDGRTRSTHSKKLRAKGGITSNYTNSFAVRTVAPWNKLPKVVVEQGSPEAFKAELMAHWASASTIRAP